MSLVLVARAKTARSESLLPLLNGATVKILDGVQPAAGGAETTVLLSYTLPTPAGTVTDGVFTGSLPAAQTAVATGTATWGRIEDATGWVIDGDAGNAESTAFFRLGDTAVVSGSAISLLSLTLTEP
jgi:hypothetical protein